MYREPRRRSWEHRTEGLLGRGAIEVSLRVIRMCGMRRADPDADTAGISGRGRGLALVASAAVPSSPCASSSPRPSSPSPCLAARARALPEPRTRRRRCRPAVGWASPSAASGCRSRRRPARIRQEVPERPWVPASAPSPRPAALGPDGQGLPNRARRAGGLPRRQVAVVASRPSGKSCVPILQDRLAQSTESL